MHVCAGGSEPYLASDHGALGRTKEEGTEVGLVRDAIAAGRLSINHQRGILPREGVAIDSVQLEPHSHKERLSLFFTNDSAGDRVPQAQC